MKRTIGITLLLALCLLVGCAGRKVAVRFDTPDWGAEVAVSQDLPGGDPAARLRASGADASESTLNTVYFDYDKYNIRDNQKAIVAEDARKATAFSHVTLEGHCDERGTLEYNLALGQKRANAVAAYLFLAGVRSVSTVSYGKERPVDDGHNETAWARNRRVEFVVEP